MNASKATTPPPDRRLGPFLLLSLICHGAALVWRGVHGLPMPPQPAAGRLLVTLSTSATPTPVETQREIAPLLSEAPPSPPVTAPSQPVPPTPPPLPDGSPASTAENGETAPPSAEGSSPLSLTDYPELDQLTLRPILRSSVQLPFPPDDGSPPRRLVVAILINEDGGVDEVLREGGDLPERYWEVVRAAFLRARYSPAQKDGIPSRSRLHIEVELLRPDRPAVPAPPTAPKGPSEEVPR